MTPMQSPLLTKLAPHKHALQQLSAAEPPRREAQTFQRPQPADTAAGQRCHAAAAATDCPQSPPLRCDPREVAGAMVYTGPPMQGNGPVLMENYLRKYDRPASAAASTARSGRLRPSSAFSRPSTSQRPGTAGSIRSVGSRGSRASNFSNASTYAAPAGAVTPAARALRGLPRAARALGPPALSVAKSWALPQRLLPRPLRHSGRQRAAAADDAEEARAVRRRVPLPSSAPA